MTNIDHGFIKQIVADRLRATGGLASITITEVNIREEGRTLATADVVMYNNLLGPEITIIEIKVKADEIVRDKQTIDANISRLMKVYYEYANQTYLCLPKQECNPLVASLCRRKNFGLISVNIDPDDGPKGYLNKIVSPKWNKKVKRWIELELRLEKLGMPSPHFV